jgi:putative lipoic acid-binding regulatory protein
LTDFIVTTDDPRASLIDYPSRFPIKVTGVNEEGFAQAVVRIVQQFDASFDPATLERRESSGAKYIGLTVTVTAASREQLDELYRTLSSHPLVRWVL